MQLDFIRDPRYGIGPMSEAIINMPNEWGFLRNLGLFQTKGIAETTVKIDIKNKLLNIIPTSPRGAPGLRDSADSRSMKIFPTFRHALTGSLLADEFQNVRKFGGDGEHEVFEERLMEKLDDLAQKHRQTAEYLRWGALRGNVYDADGVSVLYNVYTEMGEPQTSVDFNLGAVSGDPIQAAVDPIMDNIQLNALGEPVAGILVICSPGFWTKMMKNADFRTAYTYYANTPQQPNPLRENLRDGFWHKGLWWVRHLGQASYIAADGTKTTINFVPSNEAIIVPLGTRDVFRSYYGPADYMETVNTIGQEMYAKPKVMDYDRGVEIETQCQSLHLTMKPRLVMRGFTST